MADFDKFKMALGHLKAQFDNHITLDESQPKLIREAVAESVIQRFEVCYDCLWKVLKRYMADELGLPDVPNSPKPVFRIAFENNLFSAEIEDWLDYADARVGTAHDYSGEKALRALALMGRFIRDAEDLYCVMTRDALK